jgi:DNA-binding MarR family transcriptional regulator
MPISVTTRRPAPTSDSGSTETVRQLAEFRYALRKFLRFSEDAARSCGVTPQQHQLMLGIAGFTGRNRATISELADFLQERNHSVVGLVERAVESGLVRRARDTDDRRVVVVTLTRRGENIVDQLSRLHEQEIRNLPALLLRPSAKAKKSSPRSEASPIKTAPAKRAPAAPSATQKQAPQRKPAK